MKPLITVPFDDPKWRSYMTDSTKDETLVKRANHRTFCKSVNVVLLERYRVADEIRRTELAETVELARLEQEERDNADPIKRTA